MQERRETARLVVYTSNAEILSLIPVLRNFYNSFQSEALVMDALQKFCSFSSNLRRNAFALNVINADGCLMEEKLGGPGHLANNILVGGLSQPPFVPKAGIQILQHGKAPGVGGRTALFASYVAEAEAPDPPALAVCDAAPLVQCNATPRELSEGPYDIPCEIVSIGVGYF